MAVAIRIPDIGTTVDRVVLFRWLKQEGDPVTRGEPICEVETDKAVSELESIATGVLLKQMVGEDTEVDQGTVIAYVGAAGEAGVLEKRPGSRTPADNGRGAADTQPDGGHASACPDTVGVGPLPAVAPLLRNLARKEGIDLAAVEGTGPSGRVTREDVLRAKTSQAGRESATTAEQTGAPPSRTAQRLAGNQRTVAKAVAHSQRESVPFDLICRLDMTAAARLRAELAGDGPEVPYDPVFIFAISRFLREFPNFMSQTDGGRVTTADELTVAFIAALSRGLYALNVTEADRKSAQEIALTVRRQVFKAARGKLSSADTAGACFTISNLSKYPVHAFAAVLPPGQAAILAIGAVEDTPVVRDGAVDIVPLCTVTLTVDHRLINGREAGCFLARLKETVEAL